MKKILLPLAIATLSSFTSFAEEKAIDLSVEPTVFNEADFRSYLFVEETVSGNKDADRIFKKYHTGFISRIKKINSEMDRYASDISKKIDKEISTGISYVKKDQAEYDEKCSEIISEEQHNVCQDFKEQIVNTTEKVKSLKVEKSNLIGELEVDRSNRIKKTYVDYKNMVGSLTAQLDVKKK